MNQKILLLILIILLIPLDVSAIKIRIGQDNKVFFEPNLYKEIIVTVSDAEKLATVPIALKGGFAKYAKIDPISLDMKPGEVKEVKLTIQLPEDIPKGVHTIEVSATEVPVGEQQGAFILMPAVGMTIKIINVDVDYDCSLGGFSATMSNNRISIAMSARNAGKSQIGDAYADLAVYDEEGVSVAAWKSSVFAVPAFDSSSIQSFAELKNMSPGYYALKGKMHCGGKIFDMNQALTNHASDLKVNDFRVFKKDGNLNVEFDLENEYFASISADCMVWINDGDKSLDHYSMRGAGVPPKGKATLSYPVPISNLYVPPGTFTLKAVLSFEGQKKEYTSPITFTMEELSKNTTGGGFSVNMPEQPAQQAPQQIVLEQPSSGIENKTLIRVIAGLLILVILTLIILKVLSKKSH